MCLNQCGLLICDAQLHEDSFLLKILTLIGVMEKFLSYLCVKDADQND